MGSSIEPTVKGQPFNGRPLTLWFNPTEMSNARQVASKSKLVALLLNKIPENFISYGVGSFSSFKKLVYLLIPLVINFHYIIYAEKSF